MIKKFESWNDQERYKRLKEIWAEKNNKREDKYSEFEANLDGFLVELVDIGFSVKHHRSNTRLETIIRKGFDGWENDPSLYGYNIVTNKRLPNVKFSEVRDNINSLFKYNPISDKIDSIYLNDKRIYTHQMGKLTDMIDDILDNYDDEYEFANLKIHSYLGV